MKDLSAPYDHMPRDVDIGAWRYTPGTWESTVNRTRSSRRASASTVYNTPSTSTAGTRSCLGRGGGRERGQPDSRRSRVSWKNRQTWNSIS